MDELTCRIRVLPASDTFSEEAAPGCIGLVASEPACPDGVEEVEHRRAHAQDVGIDYAIDGA